MNQELHDPYGGKGKFDTRDGIPFSITESDIDDLIEDPTDFTDEESSRQVRKRRLVVAVSVGIVVLVSLAAMLYGIFNSRGSNDADGAANSTQSGGVTTAAGQAPLMAVYPNAPEAPYGKLTAKAAGSVLSAGPHSITVPGVKFSQSRTPCTVNDVGDFCMVARGTATGMKINAYFLKDAARSRLFENPSSFSVMKISGASAAATLPMPVSGKNMTTYVVVNKNSTGWLFVVVEGSSVAHQRISKALVN